MKKKKLVVASTVLGLLALAVVAGPYYANAAAVTSSAVGTAKTHLIGRQGKNLTAAQLTALKQKMAATQAQRAAKQQAINLAITNNDYNAWLTAVGSTSPIARKINANNFSQYVTLYNLEQQVITQKKALGLDQLGEMGDKYLGGKLNQSSNTTGTNQ
jgi:hypothetical protein